MEEWEQREAVLLRELLSRKEDETYANVITWLRILKSVHLSYSPYVYVIKKSHACFL